MDARTNLEQTTLEEQEPLLKSAILFKNSHGNHGEIHDLDDMTELPTYPHFTLFFKIVYPENSTTGRNEDIFSLYPGKFGEWSISLNEPSTQRYSNELSPTELWAILRALKKYPKISAIHIRITQNLGSLDEILAVLANSIGNNNLPITSLTILLRAACKNQQDFIIEHNRARGLQAFSDALITNSNLRALTIMRHSHDYGIDDVDMTILAEGILHNQSIEELDLSENRIGNASSAAIAKIIATNSTIRSINLSGNAIGDEGAGQIFAALNNNNTLISLNLRGNNFSSAALETLNTIQNNTLQVLDFGRNKLFQVPAYHGQLHTAYPYFIESTNHSPSKETSHMSSEHCRIIIKNHYNYSNYQKILDLSNNQIFYVKPYSSRASNSHFISKEDSKFICENYSIIINESSNEVFYFDSEKCDVIPSTQQNDDDQIDELRRIYRYNKQSEHYIRRHVLAEYFTPYVFDNVPFPANIFAFCKHFSALKNLVLANCGLMDLAAIALSNAIDGNNHLCELNLSHNTIRNKGAIAFAEALNKKNNILKILKLSNNGIDEDGAKALIGILSLDVLLLTDNYGIQVRTKPAYGECFEYIEVKNEMRIYRTLTNTKTFIDLNNACLLNDHFDSASNKYDPNRNKDGSITTKVPSLKRLSLFAVKKNLMMKPGSVTAVKNVDGSIKEISFVNAKSHQTELLSKAIPGSLAIELSKKIV